MRWLKPLRVLEAAPLVVVLIIATVLSACAALPTPETPRERYVYAESIFTGVVEELAMLAHDGRLTGNALDEAKAFAEAGGVALDGWNAALKSDAPTLAHIEALREAERSLRAILLEHKPGGEET